MSFNARTDNMNIVVLPLTIHQALFSAHHLQAQSHPPSLHRSTHATPHFSMTSTAAPFLVYPGVGDKGADGLILSKS